MNVKDYLLNHEGWHWQELLEEWTWLLPPTFTVWLVNRFGDLFLRLDDGAIHHLDTGSGTFRQVAATREEFSTLCNNSEQAGSFLLIPLVDELVARGQTLGPDECYSFTLAPAFGGTFSPDNVVVRPIAEHYKILSPLHRLRKDVPDGTRIKFSVTSRPAPRPSSVVWAGVVFWFVSLGTLVVHFLLSRRGIVDVRSFIFAGLLLSAALLWLLRPQSRVTFYVGAASLVISVIRALLTAHTQYLLRAQFPHIMTQYVIGTLMVAVLLIWLTYRYVFGVPSRKYFKLE